MRIAIFCIIAFRSFIMASNNLFDREKATERGCDGSKLRKQSEEDSRFFCGRKGASVALLCVADIQIFQRERGETRMKKLQLKFTPLEPYFFGNEKTFSFPNSKDGGQLRNSYLIKSESIPSQTTLFGTIRYLLLPHKKPLLL